MWTVTPWALSAFLFLVRLYHFSEDPNITEFIPRVPDHRPDIEPLVWTVDEQRAWTYYFPRDCPRVVLWTTEGTTQADLAHWFGGHAGGRVACIEHAWLERMRSVPIYRYEFAQGNFEPVEGDEWVSVSRHVERPIAMDRLALDLVDALCRDGVEVRIMPDLAPLWGAREHSFHFSGIRLRNARNWPESAPPPPVRLA